MWVNKDCQVRLLAVSINSCPLRNRRPLLQANLLVVFLLVPLYKLIRDEESRTILLRIRKSDSNPAKASWLHSGGHDWLRLFCTSLATNRSRSTNYGADFASNLPHLQNTDDAAHSRARQIKILELKTALAVC